ASQDAAAAGSQAFRQQRTESWREIQRRLEAGRRMRTHHELLQHAAAAMLNSAGIVASHLAQRLDVQMMWLGQVHIFQHEIFALDREFAMVEAMRPFRMAVAEAEHEEVLQRLESRGELLAAFA